MSSLWGCNWCIQQHLCTHKAACEEGTIIYNERVRLLLSPSPVCSQSLSESDLFSGKISAVTHIKQGGELLEQREASLGVTQGSASLTLQVSGEVPSDEAGHHCPGAMQPVLSKWRDKSKLAGRLRLAGRLAGRLGRWNRCPVCGCHRWPHIFVENED